MLRVVERFDREVRRLQRVGAVGRAEEIEIALRVRLLWKSAEAVLRHVGRGVPAGHLQRRALEDAEGAVPELKAAGRSLRAILCHGAGIVSQTARWRQTVDALPRFR